MRDQDPPRTASCFSYLRSARGAKAAPSDGTAAVDRARLPGDKQSGLWRFAALGALALGLAATPAHAQIFDSAAIVAGLEKLLNMMQTYIADPLNKIESTEQDNDNYQQQVVFPLDKIQSAQQAVSKSESVLRILTTIFQTKFSSATLTQAQSLESVLLSRNPSNVNSVSNQYQSVYGQVMPVNTASQQVRTITDVTDAQAQDAMKRAIEIDALSDTELSEADQLGQQIAAAAPGSAPILEAEADVWVVRSNAYTQAALSELMRTRGIDIANQSSRLKIGAAHNTANGSLITSTLTH